MKNAQISIFRDLGEKDGVSLFFLLYVYFEKVLYKNIEGIPMRDAFCDYIEFRIIV